MQLACAAARYATRRKRFACSVGWSTHGNRRLAGFSPLKSRCRLLPAYPGDDLACNLVVVGMHALHYVKAFHHRNDQRNERPEEEEVKYAQACLSEVKPVSADKAENHAKEEPVRRILAAAIEFGLEYSPLGFTEAIEN